MRARICCSLTRSQVGEVCHRLNYRECHNHSKVCVSYFAVIGKSPDGTFVINSTHVSNRRRQMLKNTCSPGVITPITACVFKNLLWSRTGACKQKSHALTSRLFTELCKLLSCQVRGFWLQRESELNLVLLPVAWATTRWTYTEGFCHFLPPLVFVMNENRRINWLGA